MIKYAVRFLHKGFMNRQGLFGRGEKWLRGSMTAVSKIMSNIL